MTGEPNAVSVIVPVYDGGRFIAEALDSILGQTQQPAEIIVVDDGSTDDTATVVVRYVARVHYDLQPHRGSGAARNRGVALARGSFLAFLDADDLWAPQKLERQLAAFAREPDLDAVFCHLEQFQTETDGPPDGRRVRYVGEVLPGYAPGTMLIRAAAFDRVGSFKCGLAAGEFIDWFARAVDLDLRMRLLAEVLARRRIHDANLGIRCRQEARLAYARVMGDVLRRRRGANPKP